MRWSISAIALLAFLAGSGATTLYFDQKLAGLDRDLDASSAKVSATWKQTLDISEQITQTWKDRAEKCEAAERESVSAATVLYDAQMFAAHTYDPTVKFFGGLATLHLGGSQQGTLSQAPRWLIPAKITPIAIGFATSCKYVDAEGHDAGACIPQVAQ